MTLDEAIEHCKEKANCEGNCGVEHKQLAIWLEDYKRLLNKLESK